MTESEHSARVPRMEARRAARCFCHYSNKKRKEVTNMSKAAVVYWSGTGNTEAMAGSVAEGAKSAGAQVSVFTAADFSADMVDQFDSIAFGCPSMGSEQLEDSEFEPMFNACEAKLSGKKVGLFGSYGWGDGEWMRTWQQRVETAGGVMIADCVTAYGAPDSDALAACRALGEIAAK